METTLLLKERLRRGLNTLKIAIDFKDSAWSGRPVEFNEQRLEHYSRELTNCHF